MKKIGIITLHRARNYGSSLQAYALQEYILSKGYEVEMLDYYPLRYHTKGLMKRLKSKSKRFKNPIILLTAKIIMLPSYIKKKMVLDPFLKKLQLSSVTYKDNEDFKKKLPLMDVYCTGSDQVWNSHWNEGVEKCLFLDFVPENEYCFSYSASFGKGFLDENEKEETKNLLAKYSKISVRENKGVDICKDLGYNATQVLDPTLLVDKSIWNSLINNKRIKRKYILTYNLHHDVNIENYAKALSKKYHIPVYNISYNWHDIIRYGKLKWCPSVEKFLLLFKEAQYVIADSFHATVFSIIFEKKFLVFYPEVASERISSLLEICGLQNHAIIGASNNLTLIEEDINYSKVNEELKTEQLKSREFLDEVFKDIGK